MLLVIQEGDAFLAPSSVHQTGKYYSLFSAWSNTSDASIETGVANNLEYLEDNRDKNPMV